MGSTFNGRWRVVDPTTDPPTPVPGAAILLLYEGEENVIVTTRSFCDRTELVYSDAEGWFEIPVSIFPRYVRIAAHKSDYSWPAAKAKTDAPKKRVFLEANHLSREQRIEYFMGLHGTAVCVGETRGSHAIPRFVEGVLPELRKIAITESERNLVKSFERKLDIYRDANPSAAYELGTHAAMTFEAYRKTRLAQRYLRFLNLTYEFS
jgi:hypothetical protein